MPPRQDNESVGDHPKDISAEEKKWDPYRLDKEVGLRMKMADMKYLLGLPDSVVDAPEKAKLRVEMLDAIKVDNLAPLFEELCADPVYKWSSDDVLLAKMKAVNVEELSKIDAQMKDAEDNDGDLEVYDAALAKADYVSKIWDKAAMEKTYLLAHEKALSSGQKIDVYLYIVRSAFMYTDLPLVKKYIDLLEPLVEKSGDWDRRNRLRVYSAIYKVAMRDMEQSAKLLLEAVATFTCFEVLSYKDFVFYTLFSSMVALDRKVNKEKVIDSPEIIAVTRTWPLLAKFTESLHNCDYRGFMESLVAIEPLCVRNRFLSKHVSYCLRELRIKAYKQLLASYRSVTMKSMAESFGVSVEFLDKELSRFIAVSRLNAKIDKVSEIVETNRPDAKNSQYQEIIKRGDSLLNQVGKLARAINA